MAGQRLSIPVLLILVVCASLSSRSRKAPVVTPEQAKDHAGETAKVCGLVVSPHYAYKTGGHPTFLNFDRPYPHQEFTAVNWGLDRGKFGDPQQQYLNKHVCVTGLVTVHRGQPEIILHSPRQVTVK